MLSLLETGKALYVLMAVCLLGIATRLAAKNLYKRLLKESANMTLTKNKSLKELKQRAESTYRMNQGMRDSGSWLEHQINEMHFMGLTLSGWGSLAAQLTWLCLLLGGAGAFFSYWYRLDTYYVVMYGGGAVLMTMLTLLFDSGAASGRREQLVASLQDYLENILCPRLARSMPEDGAGDEVAETARNGSRNLTRLADRADRSDRVGADRADSADRSTTGISGAGTGAGTGASKKQPVGRLARAGSPKATTAATAESDSRRDVDYLKRSLEQIAAGREKSRAADVNWLKDLKPEEVQLIGDILKEYLA